MVTQHLVQDSVSGPGTNASAVPDAVVASYATKTDLATAITHLEHERYGLTALSVLGTGIPQEHSVVSFESPRPHAPQWALWGWIFGEFVVVPGLGHVAIGGRLLVMLSAAGRHADHGALASALTSLGIPADSLPVYESDLRSERFLVIAPGPPGDAERARTLLAQTTHERLDHHRASA